MKHLPNGPNCDSCIIGGRAAACNAPQALGFMRQDGAMRSGVLIVAEALGHHEATQNKALVGPAGFFMGRSFSRRRREHLIEGDGVVERMLGGWDRNEFTYWNSLACFHSPRTPFYTPSGYLSWEAIRVGDLVLTHEGRFRAVIAKNREPYSGPWFRVALADGSDHVVTEDHGIFTTNGLVRVQHLTTEHFVLGNTEPCLWCGSLFHRSYRRQVSGARAFCSMQCHNDWLNKTHRDNTKLTAAMHRQYAEGRRDPKKTTEAAHARVRELAAAGAWDTTACISEEGKARQRVLSARTRQQHGLTGGPWIGHGEDAVAQLLKDAGYEAVSQFALEGYNYDFGLEAERILVEVDNPVRDGQISVQQRKARKLVLAQQHGFEVISVPSDQPHVVLERLANHAGEFTFVPVAVRSVQVSKQRGKWAYSLTVEDDHSHVSKGILHHNCQPASLLPKGAQNKIRDARGDLFWWAEEALAHCKSNLDRVIEETEPRAIVAFGDTAFHQLTGRTDLSAGSVRGYAFRDWKDRTWVIPTYHPARLIRGEQYLQPTFLWDVDKARWIAEQGYEYEQVECLADPPLPLWERYVEELLHYLATADHPIVATDIETPYKRGKNEGELESAEDPTQTILDISFCFERHRGVTVPAVMPYLVGVQRIFEAHAAHPTAQVTIWNRGYDSPRIRRNWGGHLLPQARTLDTMDAWHVFHNALDRGIGFATSAFPLGQRGFPAWKHLGQADPVYRCMDSVALWRNHQDITHLLHATGQWPVYEQMCVRLDPILEGMSAGGLLVDREMRDRVSGELAARQGALEGHMTAAVPEGLRPRKVWKSRRAAEKGLALLKAAGECAPDAELIEVPGKAEVTVCTCCGAQGVTKPHTTRKYLKVS